MNWKVRFANPTFWMSFVPAVLLLIQVVAALFGFTLDLGELQQRILAVVDAVFGVLTIVGVAVDHTTSGLGDSDQAMTYQTPKK